MANIPHQSTQERHAMTREDIPDNRDEKNTNAGNLDLKEELRKLKTHNQGLR
jgi:hypothetical protein